MVKRSQFAEQHPQYHQNIDSRLPHPPSTTKYSSRSRLSVTKTLSNGVVMADVSTPWPNETPLSTNTPKIAIWASRSPGAPQKTLSQSTLYDKERSHGCANEWRGISVTIHCESL